MECSRANSSPAAIVGPVGVRFLHRAGNKAGDFIHRPQMMREYLTIGFELAHQAANALPVHQLNVEMAEIAQDSVDLQQALLLAMVEISQFHRAIFTQ